LPREAAIARALAEFGDGTFFETLRRRVAIRTESRSHERRPEVRAYLEREIGPEFAAMGFEVSIMENPDPAGGPFLVASRTEDPTLPTILGYGHADVVDGLDGEWNEGLSPWELIQRGDLLYGRGTADNKGQHSVNLAAMRAVIEQRGRLGFNAVWLMESSEEVGSPGLETFCEANRDMLQADALISSDGPRCQAGRPTIFGGGRGSFGFELHVNLRDGGHHSGNWGGLIANPGILLAHAISALVSHDGRVLVPELCPRDIPAAVREAIRDIVIDGGDDAPAIDDWWGERGLSPSERVLTWNAVEVLAFKTGNPSRPVNAVPPSAMAHCQIRHTVDCDPHRFLDAIREHLDRQGIRNVEVRSAQGARFPASRFSPDSPAVRFAAASLERTTGKKPALMPNIGGSLPNHVFTDIIGMQTLHIPHSYSGCRQHAANEHACVSILREGLAGMTGLFWDIGADGSAFLESRR
jgi:acetylornithine deacetylase/succinyl-diaminopimelate desuccinylase-like protein